MVNYLFISLCSIVVFILSNVNIKGKSFLFWLVSLVFIFISGFRYKVGVDFESYLNLNQIISRGYDTYLELGYEYLVQSIYYLFGNDVFVFFTISLFTIILALYSISKLSVNPSLTLLLYIHLPFFYLASFNQIRQFLVVSFFVFSLRFIINRQLVSYISCILLASLFHKVSIILLPLYFVLNKRPSIRLYVVAILLVLLLSRIINFIFSFGFVSLSYQTEESEGGYLYSVLFFTIVVISHYFYMKYEKGCGSMSLLSHNLLFFAFLVFLLALLVNDISQSNISRLSSFFTIGLLFRVPQILFLDAVKRYRYILLFFIVTIAVTYYWYTIGVNGYRYQLLPFTFGFDRL